jgi:hypothetical protein
VTGFGPVICPRRRPPRQTTPRGPQTQEHRRLAEDRLLATPLSPPRAYEADRDRTQGTKEARDDHDDERLDSGTYYVHVSVFNDIGDPACVEWSQTPELTIEAPPPPPPPPPPRPRYEASVRSIHPGAVTPGGTYLGDTVRVRFRNATARPADAQGYRVCYTQNRRLACRNRRIIGRSWDAWRCGSCRRWLATRAGASAATLSSRGGSRGGSWPGNGSGSSTTCDARMGGRALDTARSRQTRAACSPSPPTARAPLS